MPTHPSHLLELARHGAEARLRELVQEAKYLVDLFPHLRDSFDSDELPISFILSESAAGVTTGAAERPRRPMSAAARKAVSARMKK